MSVQALSWVFDHSNSRLAARHVLLSIANHAKADGTDAWPSIPRICREARLSPREVYYCLKYLEDTHQLRIEHGAGPHGCNLYTILGMQTLQGEGVQSMQGGGAKYAPEPSLTVNKRNRHSAHARFPLVDKFGQHYRISLDGSREYEP